MKKLRRLSVIMLLVCSVFMTGCDATQIVEVIGKIAQGVQQAMPAIKSVVDTFSNIFGNGNNNNDNTAANNTNTNNTNQQNTEANNNSDANVVTVDPNAEDIADNPGDEQGQAPAGVEDVIVGAQIAVPYANVGTENTTTTAAQIKTKYGITMLDGKDWKDKWNQATADKWTEKQLADFAAIMEKLPAGFRNCTKGFVMQKDMVDNDGNESGGLGGDPIMLSSRALADGWTSMTSLVVHEMTHQVQAKKPDLLRQWAAKFWPNGKIARSSITDYGNTDCGEDMAECVSQYYSDPEKMRQHDPERYDFIKNNIWK